MMEGCGGQNNERQPRLVMDVHLHAFSAAPNRGQQEGGCKMGGGEGGGELHRRMGKQSACIAQG